MSLRVTALALVALALAIPNTAAAAAPANDDISNATIISTLPFGASQDTSDATMADDPSCAGAGASVWYQITPATSMRLEVNTFGSDYDTTLSLYVLEDGALVQVACVDDTGGGVQSRIRLDVEAGRTYWIMVGSYADGPGGNLIFTAQQAPPFIPLELTMTVASIGSIRPSTGVGTISGTVTCNTPAVVSISGEVRQKPGHRNSLGFFGVAIDCRGVTPWRADLFPQLGRFRGRSLSLFTGGRAHVSAVADGWTDDEAYASTNVDAMIRLRGSR